MRRNLAVVGAGIAGLTAAYQLNKQHQVTVFERSGRIGGNAFGYTTQNGENLDIAAAAFGRAGYPNFYALLAEIGVPTRVSLGSFLSFYDLHAKHGLFITPSPRALHLQDYELLHPKNVKSLGKLLLGVKKGISLLGSGALDGLTFEEWLGQSDLDPQARRVLLCTLCLLSSMRCSEVLSSPATFFLEKLAVHHDVISPRAAYSVRCIEQGTQHYITTMASGFRERIELNSEIATVSRSEEQVAVIMRNGQRRLFDAVVFACNADQALRLLAEPTEVERRVLGAWRYNEGRVVLHRDLSSFPPRRLTQAYTFLYTERDGQLNTSVNGALWHLPSASPNCEYVSTQYPNFQIRDDLIEFETVLRTPVFDSTSIAARAELEALNGTLNTYFCGSHFGFGLHEDAVRSAFEVAARLGVPFVPRPTTRVGRTLELARALSIAKPLGRRWPLGTEARNP